MLVNFLNQNINFAQRINNKKLNANINRNSITFGAGYDTFEKSGANTVQGTENISSIRPCVWDEERLSGILDDVFSDVIEKNPISEDLNIAKPDIIISKHVEGVAQYNFATNNVAFNPDVCGDYCMCIAMGNGKEIDLGIFSRKQSKELAKEFKKDGYDIEILRLNDKEKEAYIKALVAHELRHCIQDHLMASTEDIADMKFQFLDSRYKEIEKLAKQGIRLGYGSSEVDFPELSKDGEPYYITYVPKKVIKDDTKLKFSSNPKDNRYLSTSEHLFKSILYNSKDPEYYQASPAEMDANNCALEYFLKLRKGPEYSNIREKISNSIAQDFFFRAKKGIRLMKKFNHPPLIEK